MALELLEARIAPAAVLTYFEPDGDKVTIKTSLGMAADLTTAAVLAGTDVAKVLQKLDLSATVFDGTDVTVTVVKKGHGDGLATIGTITSTHDLGQISILGDLGQISAGDGTAATPAIKSLSVSSFGRYGLVTGATSITSTIAGDVGSLIVTGHLRGVDLEVAGSIGPITVGGSLQGGSAAHAGSINATVAIGDVKIGGNVVGAAGQESGKIGAGTGIGAVKVGGSFLGGDGFGSGWLSSGGNLGAVLVKGSIRAGTGVNSGKVSAGGFLGALTVNGSIFGKGEEAASVMDLPGQIAAYGGIGPILIQGSVHGGAGAGSGGIITLFGSFQSVTIGGSLIGSTGRGSGSVVSLGPGAMDMGALAIGGSILGSSGEGSGLLRAELANPSLVAVGGSIVGGTGLQSGSLRIGSTTTITVGGDVLGGFNESGTILGGAAQSLKIGGDLIGGSVGNGGVLNFSGALSFSGALGKLKISGSVKAGSLTGTGLATQSGSIQAARFGAITIGGDILGSIGSGGALNPVTITALGSDGAGGELGFASLTVSGSVERATISANYTSTSATGSGQIGPVKVGGDWIASNLLAGIRNLGVDNATGGTGANADNVNFGDSHDRFLGSQGAAYSAIASITIGGQVLGSSTVGEHFGFVAASIGKFVSAGMTQLPTPGLETLDFGFAGQTTNASLHVLPTVVV